MMVNIKDHPQTHFYHGAFILHVCFLVLMLVFMPMNSMAGEARSAKIYTDESGIYKISWADIQAADPMFYQEELPESSGELIRFSSPITGNPDNDDVNQFGSGWKFQALTKAANPSIPVGNYAMKIVIDELRKKEIRIRLRSLQLQGGIHYRFQFWMYTEDVNSDYRLRMSTNMVGHIDVRNLEGPDKNWFLFTPNPKEWKQFSGEVIVPDTGIQDDIVLTIFPAQNPNLEFQSDFYIDGFSLHKNIITTKQLKTDSSSRKTISCSHDKINMYNNGKPIPIYMRNIGANGLMVDDTEILFYADALRELSPRLAQHNRFNIHILKINDEAIPVRYSENVKLDLTQIDQAALSSQRRTMHFEKDSYLAHYNNFIRHEDVDRAMWMSMKYPPRNDFKVKFDSLQDMNQEADKATLRICMWGSSDDKNTDFNHKWLIELNETKLGELIWKGYDQNISEFIVPANVLFSSKPNILTFSPNHNNFVVDAITLDWFEIDYNSNLVMDNDGYMRLPLTTSSLYIDIGDSSGGLYYAVPSKGIMKKSADIPQGIRRFRLSPNKDEISSSATRILFTERSIKSPSRIVQGGETLDADLGDIQYLVLTHKKFMPAALDLCEYRTQRGLKSAALDVDAIFENYSGGFLEQKAIRDFINGLKQRGNLKYVFLIGDATYDYKSISQNSFNYVPTYHVFTNSLDYTPSYAWDDYYVLGANSDMVNLAIGRLPSSEIESVYQYIDKIKKYETESRTINKGLFIGATGFTNFCEAFEKKFPESWDIEKIYSYSESETENLPLQKSIMEAINNGVDLIYFVGHGAYFVWRTGPYDSGRQTDLFSINHVESLANTDRFPIIMASTCFSNLYDAPIDYFKSRTENLISSGIGVYFVKAQDKGAIACIGHVGKVAPSISQRFFTFMINALNTEDSIRLGDAFLAAKQECHNGDYKGMSLIGDPALKINNVFDE